MRKGSFFGNRLQLGEAVYGGGGRKRQFSRAVPPHSFEHIVRTERVLPQILVGFVTFREFYVRICSQMPDHVHALYHAVHGGRLLEIGLDESEIAFAQDGSQMLHFAAAERSEEHTSEL